MKNFLKIYFGVIYCVVWANAATNKVVCYFSSWKAYENDGYFGFEDIDVFKCTHINYAFVNLNEDGTLKFLDEYMDIELRGYYKINELKNKNPNLKVIISIGGGNVGSELFSRVAADQTKKYNLLDSVHNYATTYGFDGVDIDWEVPGREGGSPADKENFIDLLWILKNGMNSEDREFLVTVAVSAYAQDDAYNVPAMSEVCDIINVMTYDFHNPNDGKTGQNSPLYGSSIIEDFASCADSGINNWINKGADPQKLTLGLAFYGHSFTLSSPDNNGLGAPTIGPGQAGPFLHTEGDLGYHEICINDWTEIWDDEQQVPYRFKGDQWVGFDNARSIAAKVNYAKSRNLGGVMIWTISNDDVYANCGIKNGLLATVAENL